MVVHQFRNFEKFQRTKLITGLINILRFFAAVNCNLIALIDSGCCAINWCAPHLHKVTASFTFVASQNSMVRADIAALALRFIKIYTQVA
jgi:hypothetical protein